MNLPGPAYMHQRIFPPKGGLQHARHKLCLIQQQRSQDLVKLPLELYWIYTSMIVIKI